MPAQPSDGQFSSGEFVQDDERERLRELTGFRLKEETTQPYAASVKVPTLMAQLRRDFLIDGDKDGNEIFDALGAGQKELLWIEESNQRFYAYNYFGQHPERLVGWFNQHMGTRTVGRARTQPMPPQSVEESSSATRQVKAS